MKSILQKLTLLFALCLPSRAEAQVQVGTDYYLINSTFQYFPAIVISLDYFQVIHPDCRKR